MSIFTNVWSAFIMLLGLTLNVLLTFNKTIHISKIMVSHFLRVFEHMSNNIYGIILHFQLTFLKESGFHVFKIVLLQWTTAMPT